MRNFLIFALFLFTGLPTFAQGSKTVKSLSSGQDIYEVVFAGEKTDKTSNAPGIYSVSAKNGELSPIILGNVLGANRGFDGIYAQIKERVNNSPSPVLTVVDGKLILLNRNSKKERKNSFLVLGTKENPIFDILQTRPITLPPILSKDQISIFQDENFSIANNVKVAKIFVSIKEKHSLGTGFTFVLPVIESSSAADTVKVVQDRPMLIAYDYYPDIALKKLSVPASEGVYAPVLLDSLITRLQAQGDQNHSIIKNWLQVAQQFLSSLKDSSGKKVLSGRAIPQLDLRTGRTVLSEQLVDIVYKTPESALVQVYDPLRDEWFLVQTHPVEIEKTKDGKFILDVSDKEIFYRGRVDYNAEQKEYKIIGSVESPNNFVVSAGSNLLFLLSMEMPRTEERLMSTVTVDTDFSLNDVKSFAFIKKEVKINEKFYHFVIASYLTKKGSKQTVAYIFEQNGKMLSYYRTHLLLGAQISEKELAARIVVTKKNELLFDDITPIKGVSEYTKKTAEKRLAPHRNLNKYIDNSQPEQIYVNEIKEEILIPDRLYYREYDAIGAKEPKTGFYTSGAVPKFVPGEILFKGRKEKVDRYLMDDMRLEFSNDAFKGFPSTRISVFPYNPNPKNNIEKSFNIAVSVSPTQIDGLPPILFTETISASYSGLVGIQILQEKRRKENNFIVLLFFAPKKSTTIAPFEGILSFHFTLKAENVGSSIKEPFYTLTNNSISAVERKAVTEQALKARLKADAEGSLYWIHDPNISQEMSNFSIRSFESPNQLIYPNRDGNVRLRFNEEIMSKGKKDNSLGGFWHVASKYGLTSRDPGLEKSLEKYKAQLETKYKNGASPFNTFIGFKNFFDNFANPLKKKDVMKRQVVIIEDKLKEEFLKIFYLYLLESDTAFSLDYTRGKNFDFFTFDETSTSEEIKKELERLRDGSPARGSILVADMAKILAAGELIVDKNMSDSDLGVSEETTEVAEKSSEEKELSDNEEKTEDTEVRQEFISRREKIDRRDPLIANRLNRLLLLATDGRVDSLKGFWRKQNEFSPTIPMVIFATPNEWAKAQEYFKPEFATGIESQFVVNHQFQTSSWTAWAPGSALATPDVVASAGIPISQEEQKIFPSLDKILSSAASGEYKGKQILLVVPQGLKPLINKLILSRWASSNKQVAGAWNYGNPNLVLYKINGTREANTHNVVLDNFDAMRAAGEQRNVVLYGDLEAILKIQRPSTEGVAGAYYIRDPSRNKNQVDLYETSNEVRTESDGKIAPHLMWMISAEGNRINVSNAKGWDLKNTYQGKLATIILATEAEVSQVESDLTVEARYLDVSKHYETVRFEPPTDQLKYDLLSSLVDRAEIRSLGYDFTMDGMSPEEAKRQLLSHIVNRTNQISETKGREPTEAFIRVFTEFRRLLLEDIELRRSRVITKNYLDRFFSKVFPMPLNPDILDEKDPFRRLTQTDKIVRDWRDVGYEGSNDLKSRVIQTILSQTRPTDNGKPVPSSIILFGGTSSGKTFLVESLFKLLGVKTYDFMKNNNEEAEGIIIRVSNIVETDAEVTSNKMTIEQVIAHIEDLLSQPKGYRSWILFDDLHKAANPKIYQKLMTFIQSLFDTDNGMIRVRKKNGDKAPEIREIPVQNLNLLITLNPEADKEVIKRYADNDKDVKGHVLAALSRHDYKVEPSFLARWSDLINLDAFPRSAKVPALVSRIREQSQQLSHVVLVERDAINRLVDAYPKANAREFLSPAATAMTTIPLLARPANLYIVTPQELSVSSVGGEASSQKTEMRIDSFGLSKVVRDLTNVTAVTKDDLNSQLKLISFVANNFRTNIYNHLVLGAESNSELNLEVDGFGSMSRKNFVFAVSTHMMSQQRLPVSEMMIRPDDVPHLTKVQYEELYEQQKANKPTFFPFEFSVREIGHNFDVDSFLTGKSVSSAKTQHDVLSDYVKKTEEVLNKTLKLFMRLNESEDIRMVGVWSEADIRQWFDNLDNVDKVKELKLYSTELISIYKQFQLDMLDPNLKRSLPIESLNYYDLSKLYSYVIDKAIARLPWGLTAKLVMDVTDISRDLSLGQKPAFMNYTFKNIVSLFSITTVDVLADIRAELESNSESKRILPSRPLEFKDLVMKSDTEIANSRACQNLFK